MEKISLPLVGIFCVLAAIIGGNLEIGGTVIPALLPYQRVLLGVFGIMLAILSHEGYRTKCKEYITICIPNTKGKIVLWLLIAAVIVMLFVIFRYYNSPAPTDQIPPSTASHPAAIVTNRMYSEFIQYTGRATWGENSNSPVVNITWDDARAFCEWKRMSLLTAQEWLQQVTATESVEGVYEWTATEKGTLTHEAVLCVYSGGKGYCDSSMSKSQKGSNVTFRCR